SDTSLNVKRRLPVFTSARATRSSPPAARVEPSLLNETEFAGVPASSRNCVCADFTSHTRTVLVPSVMASSVLSGLKAMLPISFGLVIVAANFPERVSQIRTSVSPTVASTSPSGLNIVELIPVVVHSSFPEGSCHSVAAGIPDCLATNVEPSGLKLTLANQVPNALLLDDSLISRLPVFTSHS